MKRSVLAFNWRVLLRALGGAVQEAAGGRIGVSRKLGRLFASPRHWVARKAKRVDETAQKEWAEKGIRKESEEREPRKLEGKGDKEKDRRGQRGNQGKGMLQEGRDGQQVKAAGSECGI